MPPDSTRLIRHDLIRALSQSALLQELGHQGPHVRELRRILEHAQVMTFPKRKVIIQQGTTGDYLYILVSGEVEVVRNERQLCVMGAAGDVFGETATLTGQVRTATVRALTEVVVLAAEAKALRGAGGENNAPFQLVLTQALTRIIVRRLEDTSENLAEARAELASTQVELQQTQKENAMLANQVKGLKASTSRFRGTRGDERK